MYKIEVAKSNYEIIFIDREESVEGKMDEKKKEPKRLNYVEVIQWIKININIE